jgi:hypothetical protein
MRIKINYKVFIKISASTVIQVILMLTCVAPISSLAADDKSPTEINAPISTPTSAPAEEKAQTINPENKQAPPQQPTQKSKNASRFKPSETISEDYSVPFPVDI